MRILTFTTIRPSRAAGIVGSVLVSSLLVSGAAMAADPSPAPEAGTSSSTLEPVAATLPDGGTIVVASSSLEAGPQWHVGGSGGACATAQIVTAGPDGTQKVQDGPTGPGCEAGVVVFGESVIGGPGGAVVLGDPFGPPMPFGPGMGRGSGLPGVVTLSAEPARTVEVTGVEGATVSLRTDDGWSRDVDTTNVAVTLDDQTLAASDLAAGDRVQVYQVRNADDTYTITGLALVLPEVAGTVSSITDTGFTVTEADGSTTAVVVTDETRWPLAMPGTSGTGLDGLTDGSLVHVRGTLAEDGTLTATEVLAIGATITVRSEAMPVPGGPVPTPAPVEPTPEASAAP